MKAADIIIITAALAIFVFFIRCEGSIREKRKSGEVKTAGWL